MKRVLLAVVAAMLVSRCSMAVGAPTTQATKIVVILDGRGAMMSQFDQVRAWAKDFLSKLEEKQAFGIIFDNEHGPLGFRTRLVPATKENLDRAAVFVNGLAPRGGSNVEPSLKAAIKFAPTDVYIVADAHTGDNVKPLRVPKGMKFHVIAYNSGEGVSHCLLSLVAESGGECHDEDGKELTRELNSPPVPAKDSEPGVILK